jgi:hypothetical protein
VANLRGGTRKREREREREREICQELEGFSVFNIYIEREFRLFSEGSEF